jgi:hypothetical protein
VAPESRDQCSLSTDSVNRLDTLTVALPDPIDWAHAPIPTNDSERFLFRQKFEPLVQLDCKGNLRPGLAVAWVSDSARKVWTFTLRDEAARGTPLPSGTQRVLSSWNARRKAVQELGIDSVVALDDRRVLVATRVPLDSTPRLFADPGLGVPRSNDSLLQFATVPDSNPRDALDHGADLLVARDPALMDYVANRPEFATFPLPWSLTYVLLDPGAKGGELAGVMGTPSVRASLARDAVRADARAAEPPFWWTGLMACPFDSLPISSPHSSRVVYLRGDEVARGLAERTVALAPAGMALRAAAVSSTEFDSVLSHGSERAYIVAVPRHTLAPCRDSALWPRDASIIPLIDTRAHLIVRRGSPPVTIDGDGTVTDIGGGGSKDRP